MSDRDNNRVASVEDLRCLVVENVDDDRPRITICAGTGCRASGAESVIVAEGT